MASGATVSNVSDDKQEKALCNDEKKVLPDEEKALSVEEDVKVEATPKPKHNWKYLGLGAVLFVVIVVAITVPLVVTRNDDNDDNPPPGFAANVTKFSIFNPNLPDFGTDVLSGYSTEAEFAAGVTMGLQTLLDRAVGRNLAIPGYANLGTGGSMRSDVAFAAPEMAVPEMDDSGAANSGAREPTSDNVNDFETNNQEVGVEESDVVMSNGNLLFAAYGGQVIVWNPTTGDQVATIQLPPSENQGTVDDNGGRDPEEEPLVEDGEDGAEPDQAPQDLPKQDPVPPPTRRLDSIWYGGYGMPSVRSMLLLEDKLVVIASGYGSMFQFSSEHVIENYLGTRILVYGISGIPTSATAQDQVYEPMASKDVSGSFVSARSIDGKVHVVTSTRLQFYEHLIMPFERNWDTELRELSDEDYVATVRERANTEVIPEFISLLMNDTMVDGVLPSFAKINTFDDGSGSNVSHLTYPEGVMDSIAFVYSFDIATVTSTSGPEVTGVSASGAIVPSSYPIVYANAYTMIVATSGMGYSEEREAMLTKTYLMSFKLEGASALPHTIGSVFGTILNQYSMDVVDGVLRIATTIRKAWFWGIPEPALPEVEDNDRDDVTASDSQTEDGETDGEPELWEESTTENYIITISIDGSDHDNNATTPAVMEQYDQYKIGKPNESITAVRFFDRYAYAVTFERTDPFYKLEVSNPRNIRELAAVEITGFSQYLHAFDESEEVILALGQEADESGRALGLQISLFDMRKANKPEVIRHTIEVDPDLWSSSDALWDKNAVRFNQETGLLIIPVDLQKPYPEKGHFNGFKLFHVTETSITEDTTCSIDLAGSDAYTDGIERYCAWLSPRAMIIGGSMVVMKEHWIARKDLGSDTCKTEWVQQVLLSEEQEKMCGY